MSSRVKRDHHTWTRDTIKNVSGDVTLDLAGDLTIDVAGGQCTIVDNSMADPDLVLKATNNNGYGANLNFLSDTGAANVDDDVIGTIYFYGFNDAGTPGQKIFATIQGTIVDASSTSEAGSLKLQVITKDAGGTGSGTETGLLIQGSDTNDEVDVALGNGTNSITSVAGLLAISGPKMTVPADFEIDAAGDITVDIAGGQFTIQDNTDGDPDLVLKSTSGGGNGPNLHFLTDESAAGSDNDVLGKIEFQGYNDAGTPELITFSQIQSQITDASDSSESGNLSLDVMTKDSGGTGSGLETGLRLTGSDTNDEVDVTIAKGTASMTTIAGDLDIDGDTITTAGELTIDVASTMFLDSGDGRFKFYDTGDADDYFQILVSAGTGATVLQTISQGADGNLQMRADGAVVLNSDNGKFGMYNAGTEFSVADSAFAGTILGIRTLGHDAGRVMYTMTTSFATLHSDATVRFIAPPSGVVEVYVQAGMLDSHSGKFIYFGLSDNATYNTIGATHEEFVHSADETDRQIIQNTWVISGLTAGDTYNYWFGLKTSSTVGGDSYLSYGGTGSGHYSPFIMKVTALPTAVADFAVYD